MNILKALFGRKEKQIRPDDIEVLFHTDAAYHGEHGRLLMTNRALGMIEKPVIFCLKGISTPIPMNLRLFWHIWESAKAQGFIPLELISYGKTIEFAEQLVSAENSNNGDYKFGARHNVAYVSSPNVTEDGHTVAEHMSAAVVAHRRANLASVANTDVPAFLRKQQAGEGGVGHQSAGFVAAEQSATSSK